MFFAVQKNNRRQPQFTTSVYKKMRDSPTTPAHFSSSLLDELLAKARLTLPDAVAESYDAPPQVIGWTQPECLLMLHINRDGLRIVRHSPSPSEQLVYGAEWQAHWQSLSLRQRLQCSAQLDAMGQNIFLLSDAQVWQIVLADSVSGGKIGPARPVSHMPLRLPQHGHALQLPEAGLGIICPRGKYCVRQVQDNLLLQDLENGSERYLTCDGVPEAGYGSPLYFGLQVQPDGSIERPLIACWSPDGRYLLSYKLDFRACHRRQMMRVHADGSEQVLRWPEIMTGQLEHVPLAQLWLFDLQTQRALPISLPENVAGTRFEFYDADYASQFFLQQISWQTDAVYLLPWSRGRRAAALYRTDLSSGVTTQLHLEQSPSLLDYPLFPEKCLVSRGQIFWLSEQDGWSHIYRLQESGAAPQQLTSGPWAVRALLACDAAQDYLYFVAGGREAGIDPYYRQLYRLHLASGRITRLSQQVADHEVIIAPDCSSYVDSYARHDLAPQLVWHARDGSVLQELGSASFARLSDWQVPQAVQVTARDGVSDMYGLMMAPKHMQPGQRYPVVISIYPGCHTSTVPKRLQAVNNHMFFMASLAALGFFVLRMDGMGGPGRSKAWHDVCHRNLGDASLPDQVHALQQLAKRFPAMDLQRVAMIGSSGGGYATARALLCYPEVFKLGVAAAGNHDLMLEGAEWTEDYGGWPLDVDLLHAHSNPPLAAQMQGRLLLLHGALDDNVSVAQSLRLGAALLKEQKEVDMLILPDADHAAIGRPEAQEFVWRYLLRNL